ncbi:ubinuclein-1-like isoform X5 [Amaranthus tricolor]|uniref:ubinuclein-1-like isoform X5 n=1 Tax=Amaranthus tricolor TaxID=29722 RepID=UPI00258E1DF0|nr:ubinuclein-1-like isoform X5 [Amaranthus tricolor]
METDEQNGIIQSTERQRFYIELVPGETTIVSWKKLVKEAAREREREREKEKQYGMEMEMEMESERETEREREREREKQKEREREREREKQKERERERVKNQSVVASIGCESSRICLGGDSDGGQYKDLFFKDLRTEYVVLAATEDTLLERPYVKALECAIAELEVAVSRRRSFQSEALDARAPWFVIQRALPPEVMLKFGRVASIVVLRSAKETLSEDLVNRLVTILGKLVHRNTLKKTLRKLVMLNLFMRKGEAERFEDIKTEILSLVCHQQVGAAYIPEAKEKQISGGTYNLDDAAEDKLCDMYELCFQELPQHTDVQVLKLFIELAELWPEVIMDHHKLTKAISRAKKRRAIAEISRGQNVVDDVMTIPDRIPSQKGKVIASTDNHNPITSLPRKTAPKHKNSCPSSTGVKLASKQKRKQLISEKKNVKVKFFMKGEHETANSIEETTKVQANPSSAAASSKGKQSTR